MDKKNAKTFALVHRSHEDPLYYDDEAADHVLVPIVKGNERKNIRLESIDQLAKDLENEQMRENEGEAALYGVTFDDSKYDYMQHLKPIGGDDAGYFVEAKTKPKKETEFMLNLKEVLPSERKLDLDYQAQQDIPDTIKGFQPDMDPRLREVLEALEDEAYLDEEQDVEEGDIFDDLLQGGAASDGEEIDEFDYDLYSEEEEDPNGDFSWENDFKKFQRKQKSKVNDWDSDDDFSDNLSEAEDTLSELPQVKSKKTKQKEKRKKRTLTDTSSYSMSSSLLFRTEGLRLLDDKYEQFAKKQREEEEEDDEDDYQPFDMSKERPDLEDMLDDFLENYQIEGHRRVVKKNPEKERIQKAAINATKGKLAQRHSKELGMSELEKTLKNLRLPN